MARPSLQRGNTLIEVMLAMLLLSVGLLGLVALHGRSLQTTVDAENRGYAALAANELITQMWINHTAGNSTAVASAWTAWNAVPTRALPSGSYSISTPDANNTVTVTITWVAPGQQQTGSTLTSRYFTTVAIP